MAKNNGFEVKGLEEAAEELGASQGKLTQAARLSVNSAARKARTLASKEIRKDKNFKAKYLNEHLKVRSTAKKNERIEALVSSRKRKTQLSRFAPKQLTSNVKNPNRSSGDPKRNIQPGKKAAGVSVKVNKSRGRQKMPKAFFIPLRKGPEGPVDWGNVGIFRRSKDGDVNLLYSTSVNDAWKDARRKVLPDVEDFTRQEFRRQIARLIK